MNDVSVSKYVNSIMYDYDYNRNGSIDLRNDWRTESYFDERQIVTEGNAQYRVTTRYSFDELFLSADKDKDNKVTKQEITDLVNEYDKDKNGKLSYKSIWDWASGKPDGELDVFNKKVPEYKRIIQKDYLGPVNPNPNVPYPHNV